MNIDVWLCVACILCLLLALYEQKTNVEKAMQTEQEENKKSKDGMHIYSVNCIIV